MKRSPRQLTRRGFALVGVLWIVIIAGMLLLTLQQKARVHLAAAHSELTSVQGHWIARGGVEQAIAVLGDDETDVDSSFDYWFDDSDYFSAETNELSNGKFSVVAPPSASPDSDPTTGRFGLVDHCSLVNLNTADTKQLRELIDFPNPHSQIASILDWRDKNKRVSSGGAEAGYYRRLPFGYEIRNGPFETQREVLLVRDIDEELFCGEDVNCNGILDLNEDDLIDSFPPDDGDGELQESLAGLTTVYSYELNKDANGDDRVNVSKANKKKLKEELDFTDELADAVVKKRKKNKFKSLMDLENVEGEKKKSGSKEKDDSSKKVNKITLEWLAEHLDELTLTDDERLPGKVNVNTASKRVLLSLPKMNEKTVESILSYRDSEQGPLTGVGDLLTNKIITKEQFKAVAEMLAVRSTVFEIRSSATTTWGIRQKIVAIVDRGTDPPKIVYWYQSE